jgi:hypothetical protein
VTDAGVHLPIWPLLAWIVTGSLTLCCLFEGAGGRRQRRGLRVYESHESVAWAELAERVVAVFQEAAVGSDAPGCRSRVGRGGW